MISTRSNHICLHCTLNLLLRRNKSITYFRFDIKETAYPSLNFILLCLLLICGLTGPAFNISLGPDLDSWSVLSGISAWPRVDPVDDFVGTGRRNSCNMCTQKIQLCRSTLVNGKNGGNPPRGYWLALSWSGIFRCLSTTSQVVSSQAECQRLFCFRPETRLDALNWLTWLEVWSAVNFAAPFRRVYPWAPLPLLKRPSRILASIMRVCWNSTHPVLIASWCCDRDHWSRNFPLRIPSCTNPQVRLHLVQCKVEHVFWVFRDRVYSQSSKRGSCSRSAPQVLQTGCASLKRWFSGSQLLKPQCKQGTLTLSASCLPSPCAWPNLSASQIRVWLVQHYDFPTCQSVEQLDGAGDLPVAMAWTNWLRWILFRGNPSLGISQLCTGDHQIRDFPNAYISNRDFLRSAFSRHDIGKQA